MALTEEQKNSTRRLAIKCLSENKRYYSENEKLIGILMESYAQLGNGLSGLFRNSSSVLDIALDAIAILRLAQKNSPLMLSQNPESKKRKDIFDKESVSQEEAPQATA